MNENFELSPQQQEFLMEKMGIKDVSAVKIIFEVNSIDSLSVTEDYTKKTARYSISMCYCGNGIWSPTCCD